MSYAALGKGRGRDRSKTSPTISRMSGSAATSNASGLCGAKFSPLSTMARVASTPMVTIPIAGIIISRQSVARHAEAEFDQRGSEQPRSKRRHALGVEPQRLRAAAQDEKSKTGDFCLGRAEPSAIAMRARGRGTISRSQRGSLSAGEAQQPAGLISTSVARASHIAPGAIPRRGPGGPSTAMSTLRVRCKRHRRHANAREPGAHGDTLHSRRHEGHGRAACHAAVKREGDEIVLVPGDPQCWALRERRFGDDLDRGASRQGAGIGRHKPAEGRGWRSNQSGWRSRHSP
jgi:hypothetical protein